MVPIMVSGKYNRDKGHDLEREICRQFREDLEFEDAMTSRAGDRSKDNLGIDIINVEPFLPQCHASSRVSIIKYDLLRDSFANVEGIPLYILKRPRKPIICVLPWEDLKTMIFDVFPK